MSNVGYFQRDKGGYGAFNTQTGQRHKDMPAHWRYNEQKHGTLQDNPYKKGGRFWGGAKPATSGVVNPNIGGALTLVPTIDTSPPINPSAPQPSSLLNLLNEAFSVSAQIAPYQEEIDRLSANNYGIYDAQVGVNKADWRTGKGGLFSQLSGSGRWGGGGTRRTGLSKLHNQKVTADRDAENTAGRAATTRLRNQYQSQFVQPFLRSAQAMLPPDEFSALAAKNQWMGGG